MKKYKSFIKNELKVDIFKDLYLNRLLTQKDIANIFGVGRTTVRRWLEELKIEKRTLSEALKLAYQTGRKISPNVGKTGIDAPNWKGGRKKNYQGYIQLLKPTHPLADKSGYVREHRLIWYQVYPETPKEWIVHHLNGVRDDNRLENLACAPRKRHEHHTLLKLAQKRIRELEERTRLLKEPEQNI